MERNNLSMMFYIGEIKTFSNYVFYLLFYLISLNNVLNEEL